VRRVGSRCATRAHPRGRWRIAKGRRKSNEPTGTATPVSRGFFPLDRRLQLSQHVWSPQTIQQALRLAVEIPSHRRAAEAFCDLTSVSLSKSTLQRLCGEAGLALAAQEAVEAAAMVAVPKREEEVVFRERVAPASDVMSVSADGVMVHLIDEGWKEVKVASISAVTPTAGADADGVQLTQHSYRAGLWEARSFGNHLWAEACRRGLEQAQTVVCVSDGAAWIWALMFICFARRIEVLDWWHAVERLWALARGCLSAEAAAAWVTTQKAQLAQDQVRQVLRAVRALYPRGTPLSDDVRQAVGYLFSNRARMRYGSFRQAGYPIGSGTVESACKVVVQQRMKQAGMRWSRPGAQAMLALRCALLSDRWQATRTALVPPT
jgi:Uncharacterised protein family (UPF0236)